jgi:hypothetical protein
MKTLCIAFVSTVFMLCTGTANSRNLLPAAKDTLYGKSSTVNITGIKVNQLPNGYVVAWEAYNQFSIAHFELQLSTDNMHFTTVKRRTCGPEANAAYQVQLTNAAIASSPVYYRLKMLSLDGGVSFTESKQIPVEGK